MVDVTAERIVREMHAQLRNYDYLLPGDFVPEPPLRKRWFRWRPAFAVTQELLVWAGEIARARSLMDLKQAADLIAAADAPPPVNQAHNPIGDKMMSTDTELGPCPFCAETPRLLPNTTMGGGLVSHSFDTQRHPPCPCRGLNFTVEAWNTRASGLAGVVGERDALREIVIAVPISTMVGRVVSGRKVRNYKEAKALLESAALSPHFEGDTVGKQEGSDNG